MLLKVLAALSITLRSCFCLWSLCDFIDQDTLRLLPRGWRRFVDRLSSFAGCPIASTEWLRESEWEWHLKGRVFFRYDGRFESQGKECRVSRCRWYGNHGGIVVDYGLHGTKCHLAVSADRLSLAGHGSHVHLPCAAAFVKKLPRDPYDVLGIRHGSSNAEVDNAYVKLMSYYEADQAAESSDSIISLREAYRALSDFDYRQLRAFDGVNSRDQWLKVLKHGGMHFRTSGFYSRSDIIISLTDATFVGFVSGDKAVAVQFYSPWCPGCRAIVGAYKEAGWMLGGSARLGAVNCESEMLLCRSQVGVEFLQNQVNEPRVVLYKDGQQHSIVQKPSEYSADMLMRFVLNWAAENDVEVDFITADL